MNKELNSIFKNIKSRTGIDVTAFSENMKFSASTREDESVVQPSANDFTDVFSDEKNGKTYFRFRFRSADLIGAIDGCGDVEKNYAYFILTYLETGYTRDGSMSKGEYIKNILTGDCSKAQIQKFMRKYNVPDAQCYVIVINSHTGKTAEVLEFMENYNANGIDQVVLTDDMNCAFIKFPDQDAVELQSPNEFASILAQTLYEETGIEIKIGIGGTVKNLLDANTSFVQAVGVLRMAETFNSKSNVHSYKEFVWIKMLEEIPKFKLMEYLDVLVDKDAKSIFTDEDMLSTAEAFLDSNLNVSETSRNLFMHRNTLMYRIEKIDKVAGLNIKRFPDAVTFRLITVLYKLISIR